MVVPVVAAAVDAIGGTATDRTIHRVRVRSAVRKAARTSVDVLHEDGEVLDDEAVEAERLQIVARLGAEQKRDWTI